MWRSVDGEDLGYGLGDVEMEKAANLVFPRLL
jgi:hypothetical protein